MGLATLFYPPVDPVALRLGPVAIRWYGIAREGTDTTVVSDVGRVLVRIHFEILLDQRSVND